MTKIKGGNKKSLFFYWRSLLLVLFFITLFLTPIKVLAVLPPASVTTLPTVTTPSTTSTSATPISISVPNTGPTDINSILGNVWTILFGAAGLVAVIFIIYAGYKYITAGGNTDQTTQAKNQIVSAIIGLIIIIAAVAIVTFVNSALKGNLTTFSAKLFGTSSTSTSPTTSSQTTAKAPANATTDISKIPTTNAVQTTNVNYCKNYEQQVNTCQTTVYNFLASTTYCTTTPSSTTNNQIQIKNKISQFIAQKLFGQTALAQSLAYLSDLSSAGQTACSSLQTLNANLAEQQNVITTTINGTANLNVTQGFADCYNTGATVKFTCSASQLENTITSGAATSPTSPSASTTPSASSSTTTNPSTTTTTTQTPAQTTASLRQQCSQNAQTQYTNCRQQLPTACASQQSAYESCLNSFVGSMVRIFNSKYCNNIQSQYNTCQSKWQTVCSGTYSDANNLCQLKYPSY